MKKATEAARELAKRSVESRRRKWGEEDFRESAGSGASQVVALEARKENAMPIEALGDPSSRVPKKKSRNSRGVFEKIPGSGVWWIRFIDAQGQFRREKAGTKGMAIDLYRKRKMAALEGRKLPERLRRASVSFASIAQDALAYSKVHKAQTSYRCDAGRMEILLSWFREYPAESPWPPKTLSDSFRNRNGHRRPRIVIAHCSRSLTGLLSAMAR